MRTAVSNAESPRHLQWQAAFTPKSYQTLSPVVWQHAFVSDTRMTNWFGGSSLFLNWAAEKRRLEDEGGSHPELSPFGGYFAVHHFKSARVGESCSPARKFLRDLVRP